ncbi:type II toxin-antitoxin system VapC family toxin [Elioraea sp.]|uniref:type II toxin-antitoxin system VapC family toxin n=1 Tax=Elioraea sp. TaxID=2185103 RepID=UPI00307DA781
MIYLLDTNVLSQVMRARPDEAVAAWLRRHPIEAMATAAICQAEILYGIRRLPDGARRARLLEAAREMFAVTLGGRVLPFDAAAAEAFSLLRAAREQNGRPILVQDAMVAATAQAHGVILATRDRDLLGCGVPVVDPWAG